ncbi:MAG TPA: helix-turn-helix domain-containing protein [Candidatus Saccharimonadales bacterium]|nr:helix-turn-helix domain-containing protein [Candidatus Saccharimonadales bacterium]
MRGDPPGRLSAPMPDAGPGRCRPGRETRRCARDRAGRCAPSGVSRLLDRMSAAGLVAREPDPDDARSSVTVVALTFSASWNA